MPARQSPHLPIGQSGLLGPLELRVRLSPQKNLRLYALTGPTLNDFGIMQMTPLRKNTVDSMLLDVSVGLGLVPARMP